MAVLDHNPVLSLVGCLDFGDGEHDHVVVVTVTDQLVPASLLTDGGALAQQTVYITAGLGYFKQKDLEDVGYPKLFL